MKNGNAPLVSIITVCFNSEQTIEQTIKSVLGQTYKNIEYIIVDGKSTDGTLNIVNKYKSQIAKVVSEPDDGLYYAMNKGISMATGEIVGIINSDDWYELDAVECIVDAYLNSSADVFYGRVKMIYPDQTISFTGEALLESLWYDVAIMHPTVFIRKKVYVEHGMFDTEYEIAADYELFLRLYMNKLDFLYVDKPIVNFRLGGKSVIEFDKGVKEVKNISLRYATKCDKYTNIYELIEKRYKDSLFYMALQGDCDAVKSFFVSKSKLYNDGIYIWGTGYWGQYFYRMMSELEIPINGFFDNKLNGENVYDCVPVHTPHILSEGKYNIFVAVNNYCEEIAKQIKRIDNHNIKYFTILDLKELIYEIYN